MTARKAKIGLITVGSGLVATGCAVILLKLFSWQERKRGSKAKAWIYDRLAEGPIDVEGEVAWLLAAGYIKTPAQGRRLIREVLEHIKDETPPPAE